MRKVRKRGFDEQRRSFAVDVESLVPEFWIELLDGLRIHDSGIVDQDVDLERRGGRWVGEVSLCRIDNGLRGGRVEKISADGERVDLVGRGEMVC